MADHVGEGLLENPQNLQHVIRAEIVEGREPFEVPGGGQPGMRLLTERRSTGSSHRYQRHQPENTSLYPIVERHLSPLRDELQRHEAPLPRFVLSEFQDYLHCGQLEYGFVRVKCNGCRHELLVAGSSRSELLS